MAAGRKRSPSPFLSLPRLKKVRFLEDIQPSQIRLTVVFGPKKEPTLTIRIKIGLEHGLKPTVKVDFARGKPGARTRSRSRTPPGGSEDERRQDSQKRRGRRGRTEDERHGREQ